MSSYLPSVTLSGSKSSEDTNKLTNQNGTDATISDVDPTVQSLTITQTLIAVSYTHLTLPTTERV